MRQYTSSSFLGLYDRLVSLTLLCLLVTLVFNVEASRWFAPNVTGESPGPRCFHAAATLEHSLYSFGGRTVTKRRIDVWVLDSENWRWKQLEMVGGQQPPARDFACMSALVSGRLLLHGGWDGTKWLGDSWVLDTASGRGIWTQIQVCKGHSQVLCETVC